MPKSLSKSLSQYSHFTKSSVFSSSLPVCLELRVVQRGIERLISCRANSACNRSIQPHVFTQLSWTGMFALFNHLSNPLFLLLSIHELSSQNKPFCLLFIRITLFLFLSNIFQISSSGQPCHRNSIFIMTHHSSRVWCIAQHIFCWSFVIAG